MPSSSRPGRLRSASLLIAATVLGTSVGVTQPRLALADELPVVTESVTEGSTPARESSGTVEAGSGTTDTSAAVEAPTPEEPPTATTSASPPAEPAATEPVRSAPAPTEEEPDSLLPAPKKSPAVLGAASPRRAKPRVVASPLTVTALQSTILIGQQVAARTVVSGVTGPGTLTLLLLVPGSCHSANVHQVRTIPGDGVYETTPHTTTAGWTAGTYTWEAQFLPEGAPASQVTRTGCSTASTAAKVLIEAKTLEVVTQPEHFAAFPGEEATFVAEAVGAPAPTVTWEVSEDGEEWTPFTGGTQTLTTDVATRHRAVLTLPAAAGSELLGFRAVFAHEYERYLPAEDDFEYIVDTETSAFALLLVVDALSVVTEELPQARVGEGYEAELEGAGGTEEYLWELAEGSELPAGLRLDEDGIISGTPSEAGEFEVDVLMVDANADVPEGDFLRAAPGRRQSLVAAPQGATVTLTVLAAAPGTPASAPLNVRAEQTGPGEVTITWDPPASAGTAPITGYSVGYGNGASGSGDVFRATARQAVFTGLSPGDYQGSVAAVTAAGDGERAFDPFTIVAGFGEISAVGQLPVTGAASADLLTGSVWLLLAGVVLTVGGRRRRAGAQIALA